jgi:flagellin-like protein
MTTKRSMKKDEQAVSPVIAVIMLIAITVVIAAIVAAFAYGIIGGVKKAPSCALVVEGAVSGFSTTPVTIIHHGGDKILDAFDNGTDADRAPWGNMEVRFNGAAVNQTSYPVLLNGGNITDKQNFMAGDELKIVFNKLNTTDSITIVFTPTENVLQRITVT